MLYDWQIVLRKGSTMEVSQPLPLSEHRVIAQQKLYHLYVQAAENYVRKQTIYNWEKKEEAFEIYSDSLVNITEKEI